MERSIADAEQFSVGVIALRGENSSSGRCFPCSTHSFTTASSANDVSDKAGFVERQSSNAFAVYVMLWPGRGGQRVGASRGRSVFSSQWPPRPKECGARRGQAIASRLGSNVCQAKSKSYGRSPKNEAYLPQCSSTKKKLAMSLLAAEDMGCCNDCWAEEAQHGKKTRITIIHQEVEKTKGDIAEASVFCTLRRLFAIKFFFSLVSPTSPFMSERKKQWKKKRSLFSIWIFFVIQTERLHHSKPNIV